MSNSENNKTARIKLPPRSEFPPVKNEEMIKIRDTTAMVSPDDTKTRATKYLAFSDDEDETGGVGAATHSSRLLGAVFGNARGSESSPSKPASSKGSCGAAEPRSYDEYQNELHSCGPALCPIAGKKLEEDSSPFAANVSLSTELRSLAEVHQSDPLEFGDRTSEEDLLALNSRYVAASEDFLSVSVKYSALNFRDIMLAYNKIDRDALVGHSKCGDGWGLEFAGFASGKVLCERGVRGAEGSAPEKLNKDTDLIMAQMDVWYGAQDVVIKKNKDVPPPELAPGDAVKVVGLTYNSIATKVAVQPHLLWALSDDQDLKAFATVPCVYATCYYSLLVRGGYTPDSSVLIHAGAGGVGQAALYIVLNRSSNPGRLVFTTCSEKKRVYLLQKFGHLGLRAENIGSSRDTSFEQLVMERTEGKGVELCLNSLADDKLQASVQCMAQFGRFLEIGKFDLMKNSPLGMQILLKNVSVMGIDLDQLLDKPREWAKVHKLVAEGLASGEVVPLDVGGEFSDSEIAEAFR